MDAEAHGTNHLGRSEAFVVDHSGKASLVNPKEPMLVIWGLGIRVFGFPKNMGLYRG